MNCFYRSTGLFVLPLYFLHAIAWYCQAAIAFHICNWVITVICITGTQGEIYFIDPLKRRRIKTEAKAKVVASVWGEESIQFLAAVAFFALDDLNYMYVLVGPIASGWFEKRWIHPILQNRPTQNSWCGKELNKLFPPNRGKDFYG